VCAVAGAPNRMQVMYGIAGERRLPEWEIFGLPGYERSGPVRVGNAAANQFQLDVYGEVMDLLYQACKGGLARSDAAWDLQRALVDHLETVWRMPDEGIWEMRAERRQFTYSKVMAWVAMDRAIKSVESFGVPGDAARWRALRQRIHDDVCEHGYDASRKSFVQHYDSRELDASLLLIALTGFLPGNDPRVTGTVAAIQRELMADGLVMRYRTDGSDGLPPGEGAFLACSFWLADNLVLQARREEAREIFERLLALRNDVGLLSEEYEPVTKRFLGNFPQAFQINLGVNTCGAWITMPKMVANPLES